MAKTSLEKTRKAIAKKKGPIEAVHQYSRDAKRLHRAVGRDVKLEKLAAARKRADKPFIERATYFQEALRRNDNKPFQLDIVQELIKAYVHQYDEEMSELKKARRPGRPSSTKEDLLKMKIERLSKEHENGFLVPDLTTEDNTKLLDRWEGSWSYLTGMQWVRVANGGHVKPSSFPPKGDH
ncbi:translation machinery-associated protein 16 [Pseudomassariella vexata]|uniref:Translation machinery-associated protein 16 n=1 Tax=Pseudomassariella vexata TaxID=1141098 RepID=A0A1Y2DI88_9PEZI|nr:translation machinery-associated protein 16 [Pseudomassariella vexata]ORY58864.1 translation machinery-associated protein 16 [Pseudomassariella vexata]